VVEHRQLRDAHQRHHERRRPERLVCAQQYDGVRRHGDKHPERPLDGKVRLVSGEPARQGHEAQRGDGDGRVSTPGVGPRPRGIVPRVLRGLFCGRACVRLQSHRLHRFRLQGRPSLRSRPRRTDLVQ
jgi:hypothetical protein